MPYRRRTIERLVDRTCAGSKTACCRLIAALTVANWVHIADRAVQFTIACCTKFSLSGVGVQVSENLSWPCGDTVLIFAGPIFGCADLFAVCTDLCCNSGVGLQFSVVDGYCTGM